VLTNDASVNRLLTLPTATGGLLLRSDGTTRTLTLGPGGINVQSGTLALGTTTAGQGLNLVLAGSQDWRLGGQALTVNGTVSGTGSSQTLFIDKANGVAGTPVFTTGTGAPLNLWVNSRLNTNGSFSLSASSTLATLTVQTTGTAFTPSGSLANVGVLQMVGGAFNNASLNPSGTVRFLGGNSITNFQQGIGNAGALERRRGEGVIAMSMSGITSAELVDGILQYASGATTVSGGSLVGVSLPLVTGLNGLPTSGSTGNFNCGGTPSAFLTDNRSANYAQVGNANGTVDLGNFTLTLNKIQPISGNQAWTMTASGPAGALRIGSSGELVWGMTQGGNMIIAAPIRESAPGGWITFAQFNDLSQGFRDLAWTLSGSNSHSGGTSILTRGINLNNAYALGSGTFRLGGQMIVLDNTSAGPITIATNNLHEWNSDFAFGGTQDLNLGTGTVSLGTWAGSVRTVTVNAGNLTVGGRIVNGSYAELPTTGLAKAGPGRLTLSGSNGYTGATEVWGGELRFTNRNALYGGGTASWTAANIVTGSGAILSVSVGDQPGAFTTTDLDILDAAVGGFTAAYLGIDTTGATSGTYTYATNIPNPAADRILGIAKVGTGTLVLTGSNTFTGGLLAREGRLLVTSTSQVGSGTLAAAGGLLDLNGLTVANAFSITSGTIANTSINASNLTAAVTGPAVISGTLAGSGANGNLTKSGTGTLVLTAANTYSGTTTLSGGLLSISADNNLGSTSRLVFNGGGLQVTGASVTSLNAAWAPAFTATQPVTFDIADAANTFTVSQLLNQTTGGLTKSGSGTLVVTGTNTYTGATTITGGTLRMGVSNTAAIGAGTVLTTSGGVLDLNGNSISRSGLVTIAGGGVSNGTLTFTGSNVAGQAGVVSANLVGTGTFGLTKSGTGVLVLSGSNSYTGLTTISGGILQFATPAALYGGGTASWTRTNITGSSAATLAVNVGGASDFQPADVTTLLTGVTGTVTNNGLMAGSFIGFDTTNSGTAFTLADVVANTAGTGGGAVGVRKLGSGTLVLSASNTFTGATVVGYAGGPNSGVLQLASTGHVSPTVTIFGGTFDTAGQNRTITTLTLGGGAAGSAAGLQTGSGTASLGADVVFDSTNNPNGATIAGNLSLGGATRTFTVNDSTAAAADLTISAVINQGAAAAGLTKSGSGTLALTGSNTFTGKVALNQGVVQIDWINNSGASPLGTNTTTDLGSTWQAGWQAGTLRWVGATSGSTSRTFNLSGTNVASIEASGAGAFVITGTVTATGASAKTLTLGGSGTAANAIGVIQENSSTNKTNVVKEGSGLWRLNAASTYTGSFTVRNGTLVAAVDSLANQNGAFGGSTSPNDVLVGDTSPTATGTAALLLAAGISTGKVMNVQAGGGSQAVFLGGEGGFVDFQGSTYLGRGVTLVAGAGGTTSFSGQWYGSTGFGSSPVGNVSIGSAGNTGMVRVLRNLAPSGSVGVRFGTLSLGESGTIAGSGPLTIDSGATLAGIGRVTGTLGGAGLVAPGNSPGILTAAAVDPTSGLDWAFEFTGTAPDYGNASASINDILRLTGTASAPFTTALTSANEIAVYLDVASLAEGNTFSGGFFTNLAGDFGSSIAGAAYSYWVSGTGAGQTTYLSKTYVPLATAYPSLSMDVTTVATSATFFGESPTNGQVTTFTVVVPEPGALALAALGLGLAGYALRRRRAA
jgi:autotransporter-associated beta strand protein